MICAGVDAGSRTIKCVVVDEEGEMLACRVRDQGIKQAALASALLADTLSSLDFSAGDVAMTVATGYGRNSIVEADATVTEITCHARGVKAQVPDVRTIIDIGGQDSKVVRLDAKGFVRDFVMNDRCAAGTGRFIEIVADRLQVDLGGIGELVERSTAPASISSMCAVFAETEIVGLLATDVAPEDIMAGVLSSIASRIVTMTGRRAEEPVVFAGGVARIPGMDRALAEALHCDVSITNTPQVTGALGVALLALAKLRRL